MKIFPYINAIYKLLNTLANTSTKFIHCVYGAIVSSTCNCFPLKRIIHVYDNFIWKGRQYYPMTFSWTHLYPLTSVAINVTWLRLRGNDVVLWWLGDLEHVYCCSHCSFSRCQWNFTSVVLNVILKVSHPWVLLD